LLFLSGLTMFVLVSTQPGTHVSAYGYFYSFVKEPG
jgi:hypothetical protein